MRDRLLACLAGLLCLCAAPAPPSGEAAFQREHDLATHTILCDCGCSPQTVHDCACGRASEMRDAIAADIRAGKSGREVIESYVARYGDKIRIAPEASGFNLVAWLGPGIALLGGLTLTALLLRRWRKEAPEQPAPALPLSADDDAYVARIEREIRESR